MSRGQLFPVLDAKKGALYQFVPMTPAHCRAARGWLDWSQTELSKRAHIGVSTIRQFENGIRHPIANNMIAMRRAFEEAGVTLTDEPAGITYAGTDIASEANGTGTAS